MFIEEADNDQAPEKDSKLLKRFQELIEKAKKDNKKQHQNYKTWRAAASAKNKPKKTDTRVYPYLIESVISSLIPALYAKNPEIEMRPTSFVMGSSDDDKKSQWQNFAKTCESLLKHELIEGAFLKERMKRALLSCMVTGVGWLKLTLQEDVSRDPHQKNRLKDAQDNLLRLQALMRDIDEGDGDTDAKKEELQIQVNHLDAAISGQDEMYLQKGFVIDCIKSEDIYILDDGVEYMDDYVGAKSIAQCIRMSEDDYKERFGKKDSPGTSTYAKDDGTEEEILEVYEVWDNQSSTVYTFADGAKEWAREPYTPEPLGERWYPFFGIIFNPQDGYFHPLSDVEKMLDYQDEYAGLRTELNKTRRFNKSKYLVSKQGDMQAQDVNRLIKKIKSDDDESDWYAVDTNPNQPISNQIQQWQTPQVNMGLYDPSAIFRDVEMSSRSGDAARGYINKAKTATEAEIMSMGMQSNTSERQDILETVMRDIAKYGMELAVLAYSESDVANVLGTQSFWQNLDIDTVYRSLGVEIKAGSMSKPNKFQDREQWMQLYPLLQEGIGKIAEFKAAGQEEMVQVSRKLLEETLSRFDERIDLDEFIPDIQVEPPQPEEAAPNDEMQGGGQDDLMQMLQQLPPEVLEQMAGTPSTDNQI